MTHPLPSVLRVLQTVETRRSVKSTNFAPVTIATSPPENRQKGAHGRSKVLIIVRGASWAKDHLLLVKALVETGRYEVEAGIGISGPTAASFKRQCAEIGVRWFDLNPTQTTQPAEVSALRRHRIRGLLKRVPGLRGILLIVHNILLFQRDRRAAARLIQDHASDLMVTSGYTGFEAAYLLTEAARRGTRIVHLDSYGVLTSSWRAVGREHGMGSAVVVSTFARRILAALFPRWTYRFDDGRRMFYETPDRCLAALLCGIMPKYPFTAGHGPISAFTAVNEYSRRTLEASGIEPGRIHLVGRLQDDATFAAVNKARNNRAASLAALGLNPDRPVILCSSSPLLLHRSMTLEQETEYHQSMLSELAAVEGAQVVLSMHPVHQNAGYIDVLAARYGVKVFTAPGINELLPLSTLFVDCESTVSTMAAACGIPMVMVFLEKQAFPNGEPPPNRIEAEFAIFVASLKPPDRFIMDGLAFAYGWRQAAIAARHCLADRGYYDDLVRGQRKSATLWATAFDGKAMERVLALIDTLAVQSP
jgi:hypothetical protein